LYSQTLKGCHDFPKELKNEIIAQLYATLYVEEGGGDTRKFHWKTEGRLYEITFEQFARLFGFRWNDANHIKIHFASRLDGSMMRFPSSKRGVLKLLQTCFPSMPT
jgi:hypothetical protein